MVSKVYDNAQMYCGWTLFLANVNKNLFMYQEDIGGVIVMISIKNYNRSRDNRDQYYKTI